jgi:hypothetical protein
MSTAASSPAYNVIWQPQPGPQSSLLACPTFEVFFGGARGGGKTDGMLGEWISHAELYGARAVGLMVRRERMHLIETIERSRQLFTPLGARFNEREWMWRFRSGARLRFAYLEQDGDADAYQGHSYTRIYVEEIGTFPSARPVMKLMATLRSGAGVPVGFRATGNPGGPGHQWVKARYIDPAPLGWKIVEEAFRNPWTGQAFTRDRIFIPSRVTDNRYLGADYVANLQMSGNERLVRAWLEGDWSVVEGAFFPEWSTARHVVRPFAIPRDWLRFRSGDWGSASPFPFGWWAVAGDTVAIGEGGDPRVEPGGVAPAEAAAAQAAAVIPRGALVRYREWYGAAAPNVGLKLPAEDVADRIRALEQGDGRIVYGVLDPAAFASDGGPSIAERMARRGVHFRRADNARVAQRGALGGWDQLRARLRGEGGRPGIFLFSTCTDAIRTLPALQHDAARPEDVDTAAEDHAADEIRYACMSRPWLPKPAAPPKPDRLVYEAQPDGRVVANMTIRDIVEMRRKRKMRE